MVTYNYNNKVWMDGWMDGRTDGRMDGRMDEWLNGGIGELMDEGKDERIGS